MNYSFRGRCKTPRVETQGIFYCLILLRTHDPRLTISGGTPVEVTFSDEFYNIWSTGRLPLSCVYRSKGWSPSEGDSGIKSLGILNPIGEMAVVVMQQKDCKCETSPL